MKRTWKCRKCGYVNPRTHGRCCAAPTGKRCEGRRPAPRVPAHRAALNELPY